jgi:hypothetical protein
MKKTVLLFGAVILCGFSGMASAADYYVATKYMSTDDGEAELMVQGESVRTNAQGNRIASITAVNSGGLGVTVYDMEFNCSAQTYRVTHQVDHDATLFIGPITRRVDDTFAAVNDGSPVQGALKWICSWPDSVAGSTKVTAPNPIALSNMLSPGLKYPIR